jgi:hypothetical protein
MKLKLKKIKGARYAIARHSLDGKFIGLIENTPVENDAEMYSVLLTLGLAPTKETIDHYFPQNGLGQHCPTFTLMSLWYDLSPANVEDSANRV